jgi:hypothetical protein
VLSKPFDAPTLAGFLARVTQAGVAP